LAAGRSLSHIQNERFEKLISICEYRCRWGHRIRQT